MVTWKQLKVKCLDDYKIEIRTLDGQLFYVITLENDCTIAAKTYWNKKDALKTFNRIKEYIYKRKALEELTIDEVV